MEEIKTTERKKEAETGTSLFHRLMAKTKDPEEDVVCINESNIDQHLWILEKLFKSSSLDVTCCHARCVCVRTLCRHSAGFLTLFIVFTEDRATAADSDCSAPPPSC